MRCNTDTYLKYITQGTATNDIFPSTPQSNTSPNNVASSADGNPNNVAPVRMAVRTT